MFGSSPSHTSGALRLRGGVTTRRSGGAAAGADCSDAEAAMTHSDVDNDANEDEDEGSGGYEDAMDDSDAEGDGDTDNERAGSGEDDEMLELPQELVQALLEASSGDDDAGDAEGAEDAAEGQGDQDGAAAGQNGDAESAATRRMDLRRLLFQTLMQRGWCARFRSALGRRGCSQSVCLSFGTFVLQDCCGWVVALSIVHTGAVA